MPLTEPTVGGEWRPRLTLKHTGNGHWDVATGRQPTRPIVRVPRHRRTPTPPPLPYDSPRCRRCGGQATAGQIRHGRGLCGECRRTCAHLPECRKCRVTILSANYARPGGLCEACHLDANPPLSEAVTDARIDNELALYHYFRDMDAEAEARERRLQNDREVLRDEAGATYEQIATAALKRYGSVGSSRVDLQACKLEYSIVSPK